MIFGEMMDVNCYCSRVPPRGVFVRTLHENPETAGAKMSALCSIHDNRILHLNSIVCVHHVAVSGEAVNSNENSCATPSSASGKPQQLPR